MKYKKIHEFIKNNCFNLQSKVSAENNKETLPQTSKEYTKGQLYESNYILEKIEQIIYEE
jgi:hypothetical protein